MRAALYFTPPPDHPLTKTAAAWLGRDAFTGNALEQQSEMLSGPDLRTLTEFPRRYGFHATFKPPFRFRAGTDLNQLEAAVSEFCKTRSPLERQLLKIVRISRFFALVPAGTTRPIDALAADVVTAFEAFRAPLSEDERAKRRKADLTPAQDRNLATWGYPYVMDNFRFHMTLTGPVEAARTNAVQKALARVFENLIAEPLSIDSLAIYIEAEAGGPFRVHRRVSFGD